MQTPEPLTTDEILARLHVVQNKLAELHQELNEIINDGKE